MDDGTEGQAVPPTGPEVCHLQQGRLGKLVCFWTSSYYFGYCSYSCCPPPTLTLLYGPQTDLVHSSSSSVVEVWFCLSNEFVLQMEMLILLLSSWPIIATSTPAPLPLPTYHCYFYSCSPPPAHLSVSTFSLLCMVAVCKLPLSKGRRPRSAHRHNLHYKI